MNTVVAISSAGIVVLIVGIALFVKKYNREDRRKWEQCQRPVRYRSVHRSSCREGEVAVALEA
jgi:hypothetical protein